MDRNTDRRPTTNRSSSGSRSSSGTGRSTSGTRTAASRSSKKRKRRQKRLTILWGGIAAIILILGLVIYFTSKDDGGDDKSPTVTSAPGKTTPGVDVTGTPGPDEPSPTEEAGIDWKTMPLTGLRFTEAMSSNTKYAELNGTFPDWVELYNASDAAIQLSSYWISDDKDIPQKYQLPAYSLAPGERYIIYCNGVGEGNQAPFKISSDGEKVYLSTVDGFVDRIKVPADLLKDTSYGRSGDEWLYYDTPTPGKENGSGYAARTSVPEANFVSGVYDNPITVTLFGRQCL